MTVITVSLLASALGVPTVADGWFRATQWSGRHPAVRLEADRVIVADTGKVRIVDGVPAETIELEPTDGTFCWKILVSTTAPTARIERYVTVPASGPVEFEDLVDVDPSTFVPSAATLTAWEAAIDEVQAIADGLADGLALVEDSDDPGLYVIPDVVGDRLVSVGSDDLQLPADVRGVIAANLADAATPEGVALSATYAALDGRGYVPRAKVLNESYDVRRSGVVIGGGTAQTTALAAAVDVVSAAGGGRLFVPEGIVYGQVKLKSNVVLVGAGRDATTVKLPSGVTGPVISLYDTSQVSIGVHDIGIDGNRYSGGVGHGLHIQAGDHHLVSNLRVSNSSLDNVRFDGGANAGSCDVRNIFAYAAGQYGFYFAIADSSFTHLDTGRAGKYGIYDATANSYWQASKSWYSGETDGSAGWYMFGANRNVYSNCITQDNKGPGFWLETATRNQMYGAQADSNGAGNSILAGFYLNGSTVQDNDIYGTAFYRSDHGDATWHVGPQRYALQVSGAPTGNRIHLRNALAVGVSGSAAQGTVPANNDIEIFVSGGTGQAPVVRRGIANAQGVTGSRPASPVAGQFYFDTTLVKPIWSDGTNWKDATGTTV